MTPKVKNKGGRPSTFSEQLYLKLVDLAQSGKTDVEIAKAANIPISTLNYWKAKNDKFLEALKESKGIADMMVEASLFQRALGYSHPAVKIFMTKDGDTVEHHYIEHYPPDPTACIFWLKNRQPERWRDKREIESSGELTVHKSTERKQFIDEVKKQIEANANERKQSQNPS